jgi:hypothetical protein
MPGLFRRWFGSSRGGSSDAARGVREWAAAQGHRFATIKGAEGFAVEPAGGSWRAEWGPSQRDYIDGMELRVRADLGDAGDLQMLAATAPLVTRLERDVFEQFTEGTQTRIDDHTPEEMRWLVLYPKMPRAALGPLRERFALLANRPAAATMWLDGELSRALAAASVWLDEATPLAIVVQRSRFVLRMALAEPDPQTVNAAIALAVVAIAAARRVGAEVARGAIGSERPSGWETSSAVPPPAQA